MIGGALANFLATFIMWKMRKIKLFNSIDLSNILIILCGNLIVTIIVGSYLSFLLFIPLEVTIIGVFLGSLISMNIVGYILVKTIHSRLNLSSSLSSETETGKKKSNSITCIHCKNLITPKHRFSWLIWFILVLFGLLPGLIYWLLRHGKHKCPKCNLSL